MTVVEKVDQPQRDNTNNGELVSKSDSGNEYDDDKGLRSASDSIKEMLKYAKAKFSGVVLIKKHSLVSVSWQMSSENPNTKSPSERHSEFNYSDYSGPRTRPPSHN